MTPAKRAFDLMFAGAGLVATGPLLVGLALLVRISDGGPALFRQDRVGQRGRRFRIWKLRTMRADAGHGAPLTVGRDPRITRLGGWLRRFKLDELPQLFNVLAGEMSLVGPRPEVPEYVALYDAAQRAVLDFVPGITDPASIHFADEASLLALSDDPERTYRESILPAKIRINLDYARTATLGSDLRVLLRTLAACVRPAALGRTTMA